MFGKRCPTCLSLLDEEDLFCPNCGREAPISAEESSRPKTKGLVFKTRFTCEGCGAAMSYDASAQALRCPFCGSTELQSQPDAQTVSPAKVVPFAIARHQAIAILQQQMQSGFFLPSDLTREAVITHVTPVYIPFWSFSAQTHTYWTADTSSVPASARGQWRPLFGELRNQYDSILIPAGKVLSYHEMRGLGPYDFSRSVSPGEVDLANITVEQFQVPRKYARPYAYRVMEGMETEETVRRHIPGRARNVHVNMKVTRLTGEPVLVPVWILAYRYRNRVYRYLINGQIGRAFGDLPLSLGKIVLACAIAGALVLLVVLLFITANR